MAGTPEHVKVYDPNAPAPAAAKEPEKPIRTPSIVIGEFFRAIVNHLGAPPKLEALITEFEEMTQAPPVTPAPEPAPEPNV